MNALEQATAEVTVEDLSRGILDCAKEGDVEGLTSLVSRLKALAPRNVYVVAVEKQALKLTAPDITPEQRADLLKAFPVLIDRAAAESRRMAAVPARPDPNEERREAMEKMKRQYFERADSFVDRGEFQRALEEVRRVLILDKTTPWRSSTSRRSKR
jgi:methionyl-tRNA synthetase